jgi:Mlc titration factor MtfA (ptsG expression regulator)
MRWFDRWTREGRRRRIVSQTTPSHWDGILEATFWHWRLLTIAQRQRLVSLIAIFVREKELVIPEGTEREPIAITTAAAACLMLLGFDDWYCFDRVRTVVLREGIFRYRIGRASGVQENVPVAGVYQRGVPIALSLQEVLEDCTSAHRGRNVVIHEFAHHIDDLDGAMDGSPPFNHRADAARWKALCEQERRTLEEAERLGLPTFLDSYGAQDSMEFFSVSCEAFFCDPMGLAEYHPELFDLLQLVFRIDPRRWWKSS